MVVAQEISARAVPMADAEKEIVFLAAVSGVIRPIGGAVVTVTIGTIATAGGQGSCGMQEPVSQKTTRGFFSLGLALAGQS